MRITGSNISMKAESYKKETLEMRQEKLPEEKVDLGMAETRPLLNLFDIEIGPKAGKTEKTDGVGQLYEMSEEDYQKVLMLEKILTYLTGKTVKFNLPKGIEVKGAHGSQTASESVAEEGPGKPYMRQTVQYDRDQSMKFEAEGVVKTADGKTIDFNLKLARHESVSLISEKVVDKKGKVVDPLVINYNGNLPKLTQSKYSFDLDFDGNSDQISFLSKGSGYLAFDKNDDGTINDGRELFGPESGNGFKDLAVHDQDGNGWIDEGDRIFDKLRIWNKDEEGNDVLFALGEVGIGAIYLGHVATDYALGNSPMRDDGFIRSTGIFLKENGQAGSVQHIDLTL